MLSTHSTLCAPEVVAIVALKAHKLRAVPLLHVLSLLSRIAQLCF